jgi:adenylosuccinate lyase
MKAEKVIKKIALYEYKPGNYLAGQRTIVEEGRDIWHDVYRISDYVNVEFKLISEEHRLSDIIAEIDETINDLQSKKSLLLECVK